MKILVTGGKGFIGTHVCNILKSKGHEVQSFDLKNNDDIRFYEELSAVMKGKDAVIHMAGLISVTESVEKPMEYFKTNVLGSLNVLEAMRECNVKTIVFSSSACVYGEPKEVPIAESAKINPVNPYGAYKAMVETLIKVYNKTYDINATCLRYFNAYGPGENHNPETHVIPTFIKQIIKNEPLTITGELSQVRDYIYVEDLAEAHVSVLNLSGFNVFNVGSGTGASLRNLIYTLELVTGKKLKVRYLPSRPGDVKHIYADTEEIKNKLGWEQKTTLMFGLKKTLRYFNDISTC